MHYNDTNCGSNPPATPVEPIEAVEQLCDKSDNWMNEFFTNYASYPNNVIQNVLPFIGKKHLISLVENMIQQMLTDKNSGFLREKVTLNMLGIKQNESKLGYDSLSGNYEVKPTNISTNKKTKLNGHGNITDHRWERHQKFLSDNMKILISGWIDGCIIYILEVAYKDMVSHIEPQLKKHLPNGDIKNTYVRSVSFSHIHYKNTYKIRWISDNLTDYKKWINKNLYDELIQYTP